MSATTPLNPTDFVSSVRPYLLTGDLKGLVAHLHGRWEQDQVAELLTSTDPDTRKVAALAYGLIGGSCGLNKLVSLLHDPDTFVSQMADHAIWNVWFRLGTPEANHHVCRGSKAIARGDYEHAIEHFTRALYLSPNFAEAYNQRALAYYLLERYDHSIADCRKAIELMPCHYGALAGLGHCHLHQNRLVPAVRCYEKALRINPRMDDVREAVQTIREQICPIDPCE